MFSLPFSRFLMVVFFFYLIALLLVIQVKLIAIAFTEVGIPQQYVLWVLFASFFGSLINIPVKRIPQENITDKRIIQLFGFRYIVPQWRKPYTLLAVNFGGAVIPTLFSLYLLVLTGIWTRALIATAVMTIITFWLARPVPGLGIALPPLLPSLAAAALALLLAHSSAPVIAYISGSMGTLIGADLLNLNKIGKLGAPVASIGGAGTFDGIFINGIAAVLLSAFLAS